MGASNTCSAFTLHTTGLLEWSKLLDKVEQLSVPVWVKNLLALTLAISSDLASCTKKSRSVCSFSRSLCLTLADESPAIKAPLIASFLWVLASTREY